MHTNKLPCNKTPPHRRWIWIIVAVAVLGSLTEKCKYSRSTVIVDSVELH